jgi:hypothetical protein
MEGTDVKKSMPTEVLLIPELGGINVTCKLWEA